MAEDGRKGLGSSINAENRPAPKTVSDFHVNSDLDSSSEAQHHTLGPGANQAAPGYHNHDGSNSVALLEGVTLTGSKTTGAALSSVISALVMLGAMDETT